MATAKSPSVKLMKTPSKAAPAKVAAAPEPEAEVAESAPEEEAAAPAPAASKLKVKTAPKKAAPQVEEPEPEEAASEGDLIVNTAHEVENLKPEKAFLLVPKLLDNIDHGYFRLGGVLAAIQAQGWYQDKGHETFRAFVEAECGIQYRKAMYLIQIYNGLVEAGIPWAKVSHLGWTKLKELANILSPENVDDWVALAENVTVLQLQDHIREATKGESAGDSPEVEATESKTSTMTFKVHEDQRVTIEEALAKAKHETGTEHNAVALEAICIDFLGSTSKLKAIPSLKELMAGRTVEEVLEIFGEVFPDVSMDVTLPE